MPLDAICLGAVTNELNTVLAGCRIEKVYQPDRDEIVIQTRGQGGARRLLVSIAAGTPRVHFIETARENPAVPPMFCMLLRKHVQGAKIAAVTQPAVERMLSIELDTTDEMGVACKKHLICELMGKHSNVVLCGEDNRIIDAMRRVDGDLSGKRQVLPGLFYRMPPAQDKHDPFAVSGVGLAAAAAQADGEQTLDRFLLNTLLGNDYIEPTIDRMKYVQNTWRLPLCPSVMVGEDNSPRTVQSEIFDPARGYPYSPIAVNNKPESVGGAVSKMLECMHNGTFHNAFLVIESWNEWTEGSYLEPCEEYGYQMLEAIRSAASQT